MKGLSIDDIINNTATISAKKPRPTEQSSPGGSKSGHTSPKMIRGGAEIAGSSNMTSRQTTAHKIVEATKQQVMAKAAGVAGATKVGQAIRLKTHLGSGLDAQQQRNQGMMSTTNSRKQKGSWMQPMQSFQDQATAMAESPERLPQLVLSKNKTAGDANMIAAAIAAQSNNNSPARLLTLPFDKITKQAGMADINNATMTKGERTPLNAMPTSNTPMAQQQPQSNSDRNQTSDNESNTSGKKALKNVAQKRTKQFKKTTHVLDVD